MKCVTVLSGTVNYIEITRERCVGDGFLSFAESAKCRNNENNKCGMRAATRVCIFDIISYVAPITCSFFFFFF